MYARALFDIIHTSGDQILALLVALEGGSDEFFASANTCAVVEEQLLLVATTLAHLPPVVMLQLPQVDWRSWDAVFHALREHAEPRCDLVWYGVCSLLPATLVQLDQLRAREPAWFEIQY